MLCYRIEHLVPGLGPFSHSTAQSTVLALTWHADPETFNLHGLITENHQFAWISLEKMDTFVKPGKDGLFRRYKFVKRVFDVPKRFTVVFLKNSIS